jgi:subtilisin family serine protease
VCDYQPGSLLVSCHKNDPWAAALLDAIRGGNVEHVELEATLAHDLERSHVQYDLPWGLYKLRVPEGQESWKTNFLQNLYAFNLLENPTAGWLGDLAGNTSHLLQVVPNAYLTLEGLELMPGHEQSLRALGQRTNTAAGIKVAIVDSGVDAALSIAKRVDLWERSGGARDAVGHGTCVASIVSRVAVGAELHAIKVTDTRQLTEWDALAGLIAAAECDVINLSWSFGLHEAVCPRCGRRSESSRSSVFENVLSHTINREHEPIVVCAAGNQQLGKLRYPACFADAVAVCALDSELHRAKYSNSGTDDQTQARHPNVYFAPGGDERYPIGRRSHPFSEGFEYGTSMATAYASGVIACSRAARPRWPRHELLDELRRAAVTWPPATPGAYGVRLIRYLI